MSARAFDRFNAKPEEILDRDIQTLMLGRHCVDVEELPRLYCMVQSKAIEYRVITGEHYFKPMYEGLLRK